MLARKTPVIVALYELFTTFALTNSLRTVERFLTRATPMIDVWLKSHSSDK